MAIYYVRPNGSNTNTGLGYLATQAWATISKAASVMVAGDICYVAPGTYRETVEPTNSGSSVLPITYQGDRKCEKFLDMQMGDVIISGMNSETDATITRGYGFKGGSINYTNITNIDFENLYANGFQVIYLNNYCNILNCNLVKGIQSLGGGVTIQLGVNCSIINCKVISTGTTVYITGNTTIVKNCILKSIGANVINLYNNITTEFDYCLIEGYYNPVPTGSTLQLFGCLWKLYNHTSAYSEGIRLDASTKLISAKGTTFLCENLGIYTCGSNNFLGCKFKDINRLSSNNTVVPTILYCEFDGAYNNALQQAVAATLTASGCYFKNCTVVLQASQGTVSVSNCRFYSNGVLTSGTVNNTSPAYGETDVVAGIVASPTNPISGTKSLKIAGYDYGTVFTQWIPCEAGKAKTVKMNIKRNNAIDGTTIRLGDQVVQMSNGIKRIGTWFQQNTASMSNAWTLKSSEKDSYIEYSFTGTGIRLINPKFNGCGICAISVDGGAETNVDLYNATSIYQQNVFELTGLSVGTHKIKVRHTGTKNASSTSTDIFVDAFEYYNGSTWTRVEAETVSTSVETIEVTYTHHKTELVPLFINTRVNTSGGDFVQYDDIQVA